MREALIIVSVKIHVTIELGERYRNTLGIESRRFGKRPASLIFRFVRNIS